MPIYQPLHFGIEVLHPNRNACEAETVKHFELIAGRMTGVNFDGGFKAIVIDVRGRPREAVVAAKPLYKKES